MHTSAGAEDGDDGGAPGDLAKCALRNHVKEVGIICQYFVYECAWVYVARIELWMSNEWQI
jgi:hypothetical protein